MSVQYRKQFAVRLHLIKKNFWVFKKTISTETILGSNIWLNNWKVNIYLEQCCSLIKNMLPIIFYLCVHFCRHNRNPQMIDSDRCSTRMGKKLIKCACALYMWVTRNRITHFSSFRRQDVINNVSFSWRETFVRVKTRFTCSLIASRVNVAHGIKLSNSLLGVVRR